MTGHGSYTVNCSMLLTEHPLLERPAAAKAAGFDAIELWWPFPSSRPDLADIDALVAALATARVRLTGLNFNAGDMKAGDRGLVSLPTGAREFRENLDVVTRIGERTGCLAFNALYGNRAEGVSETEQDDLAAENLALAARAVGRIGATVLLEPLSGSATYPLRSATDVVHVIERVEDEHGPTNIGLLMDLYHLAVNGVDVSEEINAHRERVRHVQIADAPGRGSPGTGDLPLASWLADLRSGGYSGLVGLEYQADEAEAFNWLTIGSEEDATLTAASPRTAPKEPEQ